MFTTKKIIRFKPEGSTSNSLANAKLIAEAGYKYKSGIFEFKPQFGDYVVVVVFGRGDETASHTFSGFGIGYSGEGPRGLMEFGKLFGLGFSQEKVFGMEFAESFAGDNTAAFDLEDLR